MALSVCFLRGYWAPVYLDFKQWHFGQTLNVHFIDVVFYNIMTPLWRGAAGQNVADICEVSISSQLRTNSSSRLSFSACFSSQFYRHLSFFDRTWYVGFLNLFQSQIQARLKHFQGSFQALKVHYATFLWAVNKQFLMQETVVCRT